MIRVLLLKTFIRNFRKFKLKNSYDLYECSTLKGRRVIALIQIACSRHFKLEVFKINELDKNIVYYWTNEFSNRFGKKNNVFGWKRNNLTERSFREKTNEPDGKWTCWCWERTKALFFKRLKEKNLGNGSLMNNEFERTKWKNVERALL